MGKKVVYKPKESFEESRKAKGFGDLGDFWEGKGGPAAGAYCTSCLIYIKGLGGRQKTAI